MSREPWFAAVMRRQQFIRNIRASVRGSTPRSVEGPCPSTAEGREVAASRPDQDEKEES